MQYISLVELTNDIRFKVKLWNAAKGQEISEWIYEVVALQKIWTKKVENFCHEV